MVFVDFWGIDMLIFPSMIAHAAEQAGIKTPNFDDMDDDWSFDAEEFPHFQVFCIAQLCRPMMDMGEHWDNAKVIAEIPESEIKNVTFHRLIELGFVGII